MGACKDCISKEVCFKQTMRKNLAPEGFELDCRHFKSKKCIEVVRCKDCKFWTPMDNGISWNNKGRTDGECEMLWKQHYAERHLTQQDHFCSYGERKE